MPVAAVAQTVANGRRVIHAAAAVEHMIGGKGNDLARGSVDTDLRMHADGVTLDAALELLIAVMCQAHRAAGKKTPARAT